MSWAAAGVERSVEKAYTTVLVSLTDNRTLIWVAVPGIPPQVPAAKRHQTDTSSLSAMSVPISYNRPIICTL